MKLPGSGTLVRVAAIAALLALPLMVWSIFDPRVWAVLLGLSIGQGLGTCALALFLVVVARDLQVKRRIKRAGLESVPPSVPSVRDVAR